MNIATTVSDNIINVNINDKQANIYEITGGYSGEVVVDIDSSLFEENEYNFLVLKVEKCYRTAETEGGIDNRKLVYIVKDIMIEQ